jgi:hypothetical protein
VADSGTSTPRERSKVLANVREMLSMAEAGWNDAVGQDARRRRPGLMNLFTYGRSVTFAIQTMKSVDPGFEDWWAPYQARMAADPLMRYFNTTRTEIIHQGHLATFTRMEINTDDMGALVRELTRNAPPNTIRMFLGENETGGNGWEVRMPDGSITKVYFSLPDSPEITSDLLVPSPPKQHDGKEITNTSASNLATLYIESLRKMVSEFEAKFK